MFPESIRNGTKVEVDLLLGKSNLFYRECQIFRRLLLIVVV